MTIDKVQDGAKLTVKVSGRLDTTTAPELEDDLKASLDGIEDLTMDFSDLEYISSAGLRVLVLAVKKLGKDSVKLDNASDEIRGILETAGFTSLL